MLPWKSSNCVTLRQEDFLYGLEWDAKVDNLFAEVLSDQALLGTYNQSGGDNSNAIGVAQYVVNKNLNKSFDLKTCWRQAHKLRKRYRVFCWLITIDGIQYDESTNRMNVQPNVWRSIIELDEFANAYENFGDPCWEWLKIIFGTPLDVDPQSIPISIHQETIHIPSDDDDNTVNVYNQPTDVINVDFDSKNSASIQTECSTSNPVYLYGTPTKSSAPPPTGWSPWKN